MKNALFLLLVLILAAASCGKKPTEVPKAENPFFAEFATPFGVPPFGEIRNEHYEPAFARGLAEETKEVEAIVADPEPPTFANTVEALERSGALLKRVEGVFDNMTNSNTNDELQRIDRETAPKL